MAFQDAFVGVLGVNPNSGDSDEGTATGRGPGSVGETHANVNSHVLSDNVVGPHPVIVGSVALTSASPSVATVTFPVALSGSASDYTVIAVPVGATAAIAAGGVAVGLTTSALTLTGPNTVTTTIHYTIFKNN